MSSRLQMHILRELQLFMETGKSSPPAASSPAATLYRTAYDSLAEPGQGLG